MMQAPSVMDSGLSILVVPGIGNSGLSHWQTIWECRHPGWQRVQQREWDRPVCGDWVEAVDRAVATCSHPPVLIAHSIGCLAVVHWAARHAIPVRAAFLVAVPDPIGTNFPSEAEGFQPVPMSRLGFPSLVVVSHDDPYGPVAYARRCAAAWGSGFIDIGPAGHINAESGHGEWPEGFRLLTRFLESTGRATGVR